MTSIKFGTDGWRAIIAREFTVDNVLRVAYATGQWVRENGGTAVVVGHDCRFGGAMFAEATSRMLGAQGLQVWLAPHVASTPMVSLGVVKLQAWAGVVLTASHNPPEYNGFKLKSHYGGPTVSADIARVEELIPAEAPRLAELPSLAALQAQGLLRYVDLETMYLHQVRTSFNMVAINGSGVRVAYDAMYGAGQHVMRRLLTNLHPLRCEVNPSFGGQAPEPIHRNLTSLAALIAADPTLELGIANDGDADRIGLYDHTGTFVDSHHLLLLLVHYLHHYKGMSGKVVITFSVTDKVSGLCEHYGLPYEVTKVGFKYIAEIMTREHVLVGGEESGGIAVAGHVPERDGVWCGLLVLELMATTGKTLQQLIQEVYDLVGPFAFERDDLHLPEELKQLIVTRCKEGAYTAFGDYTVLHRDDLDGFKLTFSADEWVMIRPSGTEPVLRVYAQAPSAAQARALLQSVTPVLLATR